jgi:hypothetical protein
MLLDVSIALILDLRSTCFLDSSGNTSAEPKFRISGICDSVSSLSGDITFHNFQGKSIDYNVPLNRSGIWIDLKIIIGHLSLCNSVVLRFNYWNQIRLLTRFLFEDLAVFFLIKMNALTRLSIVIWSPGWILWITLILILVFVFSIIVLSISVVLRWWIGIILVSLCVFLLLLINLGPLFLWNLSLILYLLLFFWFLFSES